MRQIRIAKLVGFAALLAFASAAGVSQTQNPPPLVRSESRLVLLDVVVTDKTGHPVPGLIKDDFTVLENGTPQKIVSFEAQSTDAPASSRARAILLLDELNTQFADLAYARDRILMYLEKNPVEHQPTALTAVGKHGLVMVQNFTQDNLILRDKLRHLPAVAVNPTDGYMDPAKSQEHVQQVLGALTQIARAAVGSPSSLNVIWFTSGFSGLLQASDHSEGLESGLRSLANFLIQSRMRLYTINASGVLPLGSPPTTQKPSRPSGRTTHESGAAQSMGGAQGQYYQADDLLDRMTNMMGGKSYYRRNDVEVALSEAIRDGSSAYVISYAPSDTNFNGEYRKIEVHANVEGSAARTRRGYYAVAEPAVPDPDLKEVRLRAALASPLTYAGWNLACPLTYDASKNRLSGQLRITPKPLVREEEQNGQILRAESFSTDGKVLDSWSWRIDWKNSWTNRVVAASFDKVLHRKARTVRFLVSDLATDRIGTCEYQIQ